PRSTPSTDTPSGGAPRSSAPPAGRAACGRGRSGTGSARTSHQKMRTRRGSRPGRPREWLLSERARASCALPAHARRRVFQYHAFGGQLVADGVGTGKVAGGLGRTTLVDQRLDVGIVITAAVEPGIRRLLQQAECTAGSAK